MKSFLKRVIACVVVALSLGIIAAPHARAAFGQTIVVAQAALPAPDARTLQPAPQYVVPIPASDPKIVSGGTIVGEIIQWMVMVFGPILAGLVVAAFVKLLRLLGVQVDDARRARLEEIVSNGLANAADEARTSLDGKLPVEIKNKVVADTVEYAQRHGAETLKALGVDPSDPKAVEAIRARATKILADKGIVT